LWLYCLFRFCDVLFIGPHLATFFVFLTCLFLEFHGAYGILMLLILAEVTRYVVFNLLH
jgi:hypothetical protein